MIRNAEERNKRIRTGLSFQNRIRDKIIEVFFKHFPRLTEEEITSCPACVNGSDIHLSKRFSEIFPVGIEAKFNMKNYRTINKDYNQAVKQVERIESHFPIYPVLAITGGHSRTFMLMTIDHYLEVFVQNALMREKLQDLELDVELCAFKKSEDAELQRRQTN